MAADKRVSRALPKIELHAHLNGSISAETISRLIKEKRDAGSDVPDHWKTTIEKGADRTFSECFVVFGVIYQLVDSEETVTQVTREVIREFADDNVKYLELRSTPRANPATGMTKESYVNAVLLGIEKAKATSPSIMVRYLVSINRKYGPDEAMDTVHLAMKFKERTAGIVVGVDLSGDPSAFTSRDFLPALYLAKESGLKLAIHLAEVPSVEEAQELLDIIPDRIGHGTCLHPDKGGAQRLVDIVEKHRIPIEVCLTSNIKTESVSSFSDHHIGYWYSRGHPLTICLLDRNYFSPTCTSSSYDIIMTQEYSIAAETLNLTVEQMWQLSCSTIDQIFAEDSVKQSLKELWEKEKQAVLGGQQLQ